jgi:effector-binding domain-containing protein
MTIDFAMGRAPALRVASVRWKGPWKETKIRQQFEKVERWAKAEGLRTGVWVFREPGERSWEAGIEVKGSARSRGGIRLRTLPATPVAKVVFDPEVVSPRVVYHGLTDWLRWRRKDGEIRSVVSSREIYRGNPWRDAKVWAKTEIQFVVRK